MKIKKVRRKCGVRGCRCTDSFAISQSNEMGNSVIVCKNCILEAAKLVDNYKEDEKPANKGPREIPTLFFNAKAMGKTKTNDGSNADAPVVNEEPIVEKTVITEETEEPEEITPVKEPEEPVKPAPKPSANKKKGAQKK